MIELSEQQMSALEKAEASPPRIANPRTKETFVLLRVDEYERLKEREYDADIATMPHREEAEVAELAFRHAERTAKALEKELMAWQSINSSIRTMYGAAGAGQR